MQCTEEIVAAIHNRNVVTVRAIEMSGPHCRYFSSTAMSSWIALRSHGNKEIFADILKLVKETNLLQIPKPSTAVRP